MPVIAPILSVAVAGWSTSVAIAGGTLFSFATLTAVSSVVGAVGVITKNKTLMTIGAVGAAVGGVGMWAQSTGAFGATAAKAAEVAPGATGTAVATPTAATGTATGTATASAGVPIAPVAAGDIIENITVTGAPLTNAPLATTGAAIVAGAAAKTPPDGTPGQASETLTAKKVDVPDDNGFLKGFKDFAKDNGALLVLGGTTLSGLFEQPAPGSAERTRAETELLAAQALEKKTQLANMQAPLGSFTPPAVPGYRGIDPVTGRQVQYATRTAADPGLINTITGAPV